MAKEERVNTRKCPRCGRVLEESWKACPYCGRNLIQPRPPPRMEEFHLCAKCGKDFVGRQCPYCGLEAPKSTETSRQSLSTFDYRIKPTALWYLVPFLFGLLGGIIAYVGVKGDDRNMANNLLWFGILWSLILFVLGWIFFIPIFFH
jgi:RNA polymerase subunit RPABC4/transcription elongation factor Spt4